MRLHYCTIGFKEGSPVVVIMLYILEDWAREALDLRRVEVAHCVVVFSIDAEHRTWSLRWGEHDSLS